MRRSRRYNANSYYNVGRTSYGKYKRKYPGKPFYCKYLRRNCINQNFNLCEGCTVLCYKNLHGRLKKKCETCKFKFQCWTGEFNK